MARLFAQDLAGNRPGKKCTSGSVILFRKQLTATPVDSTEAIRYPHI